jgi:hypothetical protein
MPARTKNKQNKVDKLSTKTFQNLKPRGDKKGSDSIQKFDSIFQKCGLWPQCYQGGVIPIAAEKTQLTLPKEVP